MNSVPDGTWHTALKRKYKTHRIRAHANPLNDLHMDYPLWPSEFDLKKYYPELDIPKEGPVPRVTMADIGCGFGGLVLSLSTAYPDEVVMGMEIRSKVSCYVNERIEMLRKASTSGEYKNAAVVNTNAMKYLPNFFEKGQLKKIFFCFPDPHFKKANHRRRIISKPLLAEYAYILGVGGIAYTITDVEELHIWMRDHFDEHPLFERIPEEELADDVAVRLIAETTEESKKVDKVEGPKFKAIYRRVAGKD